MANYEEFMKSTAPKTTESSYERICYAIAFLAIIAIVAITLVGYLATTTMAATATEAEPTSQVQETVEEKGPSIIVIPEDIEIVVPSSKAPSKVVEEPYHWDPQWIEDLHVNERAKQEAAAKAAEEERRQEKLVEDCPLSAELQWIAHDAVRESGVISLSTFFALMEHESGFQTGAISPTDDYGLCQVNSCTIPYLYQEMGIISVDELLDGETNIRASICLLEYTSTYANSEAELLSMYHMGVGGYEEWSMTSGGYVTTPALEIIEMSANYEELD